MKIFEQAAHSVLFLIYLSSSFSNIPVTGFVLDERESRLEKRLIALPPHTPECKLACASSTITTAKGLKGEKTYPVESYCEHQDWATVLDEWKVESTYFGIDSFLKKWNVSVQQGNNTATLLHFTGVVNSKTFLYLGLTGGQDIDSDQNFAVGLHFGEYTHWYIVKKESHCATALKKTYLSYVELDTITINAQ